MVLSLAGPFSALFGSFCLFLVLIDPKSDQSDSHFDGTIVVMPSPSPNMAGLKRDSSLLKGFYYRLGKPLTYPNMVSVNS